jgi:hypothetical protein
MSCCLKCKFHSRFDETPIELEPTRKTTIWDKLFGVVPQEPTSNMIIRMQNDRNKNKLICTRYPDHKIKRKTHLCGEFIERINP